MTIFGIGIGLHVLIASFFAIHALRTKQSLLWLVGLYVFPVLGSLIYAVMVFFSKSRIGRNTHQTLDAVARTIDPDKELREARSAFELMPTPQNQMRLAHALLESGNTKEAAFHYESCLRGSATGDPDIGLYAAHAFMEYGRADRALPYLQAIRGSYPHFNTEQVALLMARALSAVGRKEDARMEFTSALHRFGTFQVKAEYAIWAIQMGDAATAERLNIELERTMQFWNHQARDMNKNLLHRWNAAMKGLKKEG